MPNPVISDAARPGTLARGFDGITRALALGSGVTPGVASDVVSVLEGGWRVFAVLECRVSVAARGSLQLGVAMLNEPPLRALRTTSY